MKEKVLMVALTPSIAHATCCYALDSHAPNLNCRVPSNPTCFPPPLCPLGVTFKAWHNLIPACTVSPLLFPPPSPVFLGSLYLQLSASHHLSGMPLHLKQSPYSVKCLLKTSANPSYDTSMPAHFLSPSHILFYPVI